MFTCQYCHKSFPTQRSRDLHQDRFCRLRPQETPNGGSGQDSRSASPGVWPGGDTGANNPAVPAPVSPPPVHGGDAGDPLPKQPPSPVSPPPSQNHRLSVPVIDKNYILPRAIRDKMERVEIRSRIGPVNILLLGPQGSGKTSLARQFAARYNRLSFVAPCVTMQEPKEWWGQQKFDPDRGTYYVPSLFVQAVQTPRCVIVLDDLNRVENPKVLNSLFPLLDDRRSVWIEEMGETLRVAPGVVFFATMNEGWEFQGTDPFDVALRDRFDEFKMSSPPEHIVARILSSKTGLDTSIARALASFAISCRDNPKQPINISLRKLILVAEDIVAGANLRDAVEYTILAGIDQDYQETVLQALQESLSSLQVEYQSLSNQEWEIWA